MEEKTIEFNCLVCKETITAQEKFSMSKCVPNVEPEIMLGNALKLITQLNTPDDGTYSLSQPNFDFDETEAFTCTTCFENTSAALEFKYLCQQSIDNLQELMESNALHNTCSLCHRILPENRCIDIDKCLPNILPILTQKEAISLICGPISDTTNILNQTCYVCFNNLNSYIRFVIMFNQSKNKENKETDHISEEKMHISEIESSEEFHEELFKNQQCIFCSDTFRDNKSLKHHLRLKHLKEAKQIDPNINNFKCKLCGDYYSIGRYYIHIRTHTEEKPFECSICKKTFIDKSTLKHHLPAHDVSRPHLCSICGVSYKRVSHLNQHLRKHDGKVKPQTCRICGKTYKCQKGLRKHTRRDHLDIFKFQCEYCAAKYSRLSYLNRHRRKEHSQDTSN